MLEVNKEEFMKNTYVVSDIHGRGDLLKEMVDECMDLKEDKLILLGDYIDGDEDSNSYKTLRYIYDLTKKYPNHVIVLKGNHEEWLAHFVFQYPRVLNTYVTPEISTIQDFMTSYDFINMTNEAKRKSKNYVEFTDVIKEMKRDYLLTHHQKLIEWLHQLPLYYETKNEVFVHAGIDFVSEYEELWKEISNENDFLMDFSATIHEAFPKIVVSGHISTGQVKHDPSFHDIYRYKNRIFIDSTVLVTKRLNLLKIKDNHYFEVKKNNDHTWSEKLVIDFAKR